MEASMACPTTLASSSPVCASIYATIPSNYESPSRLSTKRKHRIGLQHAASMQDSKRVKGIGGPGRPRNVWTRSRSRKLIRLYLMSPLDVDEIAAVLRSTNFEPCKRDIQKQLEVLLQRRPNKIRSRGIMTRVRLCLLRECREQVASTEPQMNPEAENMNELPQIEKSSSRDNVEVRLPNSADSTVDLSWIELGFETDLFHVLGCEGGLSSEHSKINQSLPSSAGIGFALSEPEISPPPNDMPPEVLHTPSLSSIPLLDANSFSMSSTISPLVLHAVKPPSYLPNPCTQANAYPKESNEQCLSESLDATPIRLSQIFRDSNSKEAHRDKSITSSDAKSYQASEISIRSLRRRLSLKTESCLGDIVSLMQNFTIGGSSSLSGKKTQYTSSKAFSGTILSTTDAEKHLPTVGELQASSFSGQASKEHTMPLPGIFSNYQWEDFGESLETGPSYRRYALDRRRPHPPKTFSKTGIQWTNLIATVRNETVDPKDFPNDIFGNSILHIAAALGKTPKYLLHLLDLHANMHALNSANQTFLHLLQPVCVEDCMDLCSLLNRLQVENFNFHQRDDHGQTPLHLITRPWISWTVLDETAAELHYSKIVLPLSRDNLGRTILGQLAERRIGKPEIDRLQQRAAAHARDDKTTSKSAVQDAEVDGLCLPNYGNQTFIETVEDLLVYEQHADLLRTIVRACKFPQFEDANGRNGLHCLAEARNLPLLDAAIGYGRETDIALTSARREAYLEDLLVAGVDIDNHDNLGLTPLMAFILHIREGEDDDTTSRILSRLCEAGANINRRNRKGETPLHIAVKLGRRAATKFLISKKANIQARDSSGMGVLALALVHSKKATQNETLYAQIMLCMSLVVDAGAVSAPTTLQEWAVDKRALWKLPKLLALK